MPMINNNPTMKTGFGGIGMYLFPMSRADTISPPSTLMFIDLYSTNKSYVFGLPAALFFGEDKYRATAAVFTTRMNMDFTYDIGEQHDIKLVYSELRTIYFLEFSRQVAKPATNLTRALKKKMILLKVYSIPWALATILFPVSV